MLCAVVLCLGLLSTPSFGAVQGSKMRITAAGCTTAQCPITLTVKAVVAVTPTGTAEFLLGSTVLSGSGGSCDAIAMAPKKQTWATATCDATGVPHGVQHVTVRYSGDDYLDPNTTSRAIRVKAASNGVGMGARTSASPMPQA